MARRGQGEQPLGRRRPRRRPGGRLRLTQGLIQLAAALVEQRGVGQLIDAHAAVDAAEHQVDAAAVLDVGQGHRREQEPGVHPPHHPGLRGVHREHVAKRGAADEQAGAGRRRLHAQLARRGVGQADKAPLRKQQRAQAAVAADALQAAAGVGDDQLVLAQDQVGHLAGQERHLGEVAAGVRPPAEAVVEDLDPQPRVLEAAAQHRHPAGLAAVADKADLAKARRAGAAVLELGDVPLRAVAGQLELAIHGAALALLDRGDDRLLAAEHAEAGERHPEELAAVAMGADRPAGHRAALGLAQGEARGVHDVIAVDDQHLVFAVAVQIGDADEQEAPAKAQVGAQQRRARPQPTQADELAGRLVGVRRQRRLRELHEFPILLDLGGSRSSIDSPNAGLRHRVHSTSGSESRGARTARKVKSVAGLARAPFAARPGSDREGPLL